ncbi:MAG: glycosyltransferase, partial [Flavobacteriales bacterium]
MNIIIIGPAYPYRGGIADGNERLAKEFMTQGHKVHLHTFSLQYPRFLFPGKTQYKTEKKSKELIVSRSINSINPFNWFAVGKKIRKEKPDLVIIRYWIPFLGPCFGTLLRRIKKDKSIPVISVVDNLIPHEPRLGDKMFTRYFSKPVDAFVAMSKSVLNDIEQLDKTKLKRLSPHPLFDNYGDKLARTEALNYLNLDKTKRYLLFFGLVRAYKGLDILLEAMQSPKLRAIDFQLIIAGEYYSNRSDYEDQLIQLKRENRLVEVQKFIPDAEIKYYFSASDLLVLPYKSATQSGVTQIAYHFNLPMLVTDVGGLKELCPPGKVGYVVEPKADEVAEAIVDF